MPIMSKTYRAAFRWLEQDGVPVATVTELNGRGWLLCCPLCGCLHETRMAQLTGPYKPDCLLRTLARMPAPRGNTGANWRRVLQDWYSLYPEAAAHDTVLLLAADAAALVAQEAQDARREAARQRRNERRRAARAAQSTGTKRGRPRKDRQNEELENAA